MARPEFCPSKKMRHSVSVAAGAGVAQEKIALGLGISRTTLVKHFDYELTIGAHERRQEILDAMFRVAKKGNVAAQKAYAALTSKLAAAPSPLPTKPKALGKKEQKNVDAGLAQVGTEWADILPSATAQ